MILTNTDLDFRSYTRI